MRRSRIALLALLVLITLGCSTADDASEATPADDQTTSSSSARTSPDTTVENDPGTPRLQPGTVEAGEPVELVTAQGLGVGYTIAQLNDDGVFVTRWGAVSDGNPEGSGSLEIFADLAQFGYEDVGVPPTQKSRIPTPAGADDGLYTICPDNNPDLDCFLLAIGEIDNAETEACGQVCLGIAPGDPIPRTVFQPAYGFVRDGQLTFVVPANRQRPDTFILETRNSATSEWEPTYRLISHPYSLAEPNPVTTSIESLDGAADRTPEIIETGTRPVGDTWELPGDVADTDARLCSIDRQSMPCLYW